MARSNQRGAGAIGGESDETEIHVDFEPGERLGDWAKIHTLKRPDRFDRFASPFAMRLELLAVVGVVIALGRLIPSFGSLLYNYAKFLLP